MVAPSEPRTALANGDCGVGAWDRARSFGRTARNTAPRAHRAPSCARCHTPRHALGTNRFLRCEVDVDEFVQSIAPAGAADGATMHQPFDEPAAGIYDADLAHGG